MLVLSDRAFHAALPCVCRGLPLGGGCVGRDAVHLQRGGRAPLDAQDGRSDCTNILRLDVQERLQRSAKLHPESGGLLVGRRKSAMRALSRLWRRELTAGIAVV